MSKRDTDTYRRLIQAGKELLPEQGMAGLSIRRVCRRAKVNLGMFHYHFRAKNIFARLIIEEIYDQFFRRLRVHADGDGEGNIRRRLENALTTVARAVRDDRQIATAIMFDAIRGHGPTVHFLMGNVPRHGRVIGDLIRRGMRKGIFRRMPSPIAEIGAHFTTVVPCIIFGMMERGFVGSRLRPMVKWMAPFIISDKAIRYRVEIVVRGLLAGTK